MNLPLPTRIAAPIAIRRSTPLVGAILSTFALCACGPVDNLTAYDVEITIFEDCTQVASSAPQCADEEDLRTITRTGRWYIENLGGGNAIIPLDQFILINDQGRSVTGVHFADNGSVMTNSCDGEGGQCYFARTQVDEANPADPEDEPDNRCKTIARAYDFKVDVDGILKGIWQDIRVENEICDTPAVGQVLAEVLGTLAEESVIAREDRP